MFLFLVDWGNGFIGGYSRDFVQEFNTPKGSIFDDLERLNVSKIKIITPAQLDELRGYHRPSMQEYLQA